MIILDTSILINFLKSNKKVVNSILSLKENFAISSVTLAEIEIGFYAYGLKRQIFLKNYFRGFIKEKNIAVLVFNELVAYKYAELQASLLKKGQELSPFDCVIASTALTYNATLLTQDEDFRRVKGLKLLFPS